MRRRDSKTGAPAMIEFRIRVENLGVVPCTLEQHTLQLLSGKLEPFGAAMLESSDPPLIAPNANANYTVLFPLPADRTVENVDVLALNLRWAISFDGEAVTTGVTFERIVPLSSDEPRVSVGLGFFGHS
jgi:hypothetical protein